MPNRQTMKLRGNISTLAAVSLLLGTIAATPSPAAITPNDAVQAIQDAKVLPGDARIKVQVNKDVANVSTFHHDKDNLNDLKIDAVMIGKAIMDAPSSDIVRVIVYFYNQALTDMKVVSVSAGDIKAFGAGQMANDDLLRSLTVETKSLTKDDNDLTSYLGAARSSRADSNTKVSVTQDVMNVWAPIEYGMTERDCKIEGLRLAERAKAVAPENVHMIKVYFSEPGQYGHERSMSFEVDRLAALSNTITTALDDVKLSTNAKASRAIDVALLNATSGPMFDERKGLLDRIQQLAKDGVGIKPFVDAFIQLEATVATAPKDKLTEAISRLSTQLEEQEKRSRQAKEFQPKAGQPVVAAASGGSSATAAKKTVYSAPVDVDSGANAFPPQMANQILSDPNGTVGYWEHRYKRGGHQPEEYPNFIKILDFAAQTLKNANRSQEAEAFAKRAQAGRELRKKNASAGP